MKERLKESKEISKAVSGILNQTLILNQIAIMEALLDIKKTLTEIQIH